MRGTKKNWPMTRTSAAAPKAIPAMRKERALPDSRLLRYSSSPLTISTKNSVSERKMALREIETMEVALINPVTNAIFMFPVSWRARSAMRTEPAALRRICRIRRTIGFGDVNQSKRARKAG